MFRIHNRALSAGLLCRSDDLQGEGGFTRAFGAINLDNPSARKSADTEGKVKSDRACRDDFDFLMRVAAQLHDRAFTKGFFNLAEGGIEGFLLFGGVHFVSLRVLAKRCDGHVDFLFVVSECGLWCNIESLSTNVHLLFSLARTKENNKRTNIINITKNGFIKMNYAA